MADYKVETVTEAPDVVMVDGERFKKAEIARNKLDAIIKPPRDLTQYRSMFATDDQFDIFSRLPCNHEARMTILEALREDSEGKICTITDK